MQCPLFVKKHVSFSCILPLRKYNVFQYPSTLWRNPLKNAVSLLKETHLLPNDMVPLQAGNIPVPYVACFSVYSRLFHMQNSCQTVQYPMHQSNIPWKSCKAKMTMLLAHSSFPIRLHSILVKKPCSCKKKTWHMEYSCWKGSVFLVCCF